MPKVKKAVKKVPVKKVKSKVATVKKAVKTKKVVKKTRQTTKTVTAQTADKTTSTIAMPAPTPLPEQTVADKIWTDIKDRPIEMFALPGQTAAKYCKQVKIEPTKLYLTASVAAVLPALEEAFKHQYNVELVDRYIVVSNKTNLPKKF